MKVWDSVYILNARFCRTRTGQLSDNDGKYKKYFYSFVELIKFKQFYCKFSWNLKIIIIVLLFLEKMYNFSAPLKNVCYNFLN